MPQNTPEKLNLIIESLEKNTLLIATDWIKESSVKSIFDNRKISRKKFRDGYCVPIIEYFIAVIRKEKEAGDCPIMSKFVHYMLAKQITPKEVFLICMGFRKSLISFLLKEEEVLKDPLTFMDEVALIFDANLSGVLEIFSNLYSETQKKIEIAKAQQTKLQQTTRIINSINTKIMILQGSKILLLNKPFLEMLGIEDLKDFYKKYDNGFEFFQSVNTHEKDFKQNTERWIEKICTEKIHFKTNIYHEQISQTLSYSGRITKLPSENENQYIIALSNITEHLKSEEMMEDYLSHDEITGFKNYSNFESHLKVKMEDKGENVRLFLSVLDLVNLREINSQKGRASGDSIISEIAEDLRFVENENTVFARLEGSRFGILLEYEKEQDAYDWCVELYKKVKERDAKINLSITEMDYSQSVNKLFIRSFNLIEEECKSKVINNDLENIIEYKELQNQEEFTLLLKETAQVDTSFFFKQMPVSSKSQVLSTTTHNAQLLLSAKQMAVVEVDSFIYFKLAEFGNVVANISAINERKKSITINEFRKDTHSPLNRKALRIEAGENIKAYINFQGYDYNVKVFDMNQQCVAVEIDRMRNIDLESLVHLNLLLPVADTQKSCKADASVTRINKTPAGYKLVLLCHLDDKNLHNLSEYISDQQMKNIKIMNDY